MKLLVISILFFCSCSIENPQYEKETMPKPVEHKKENIDTTKKIIPVKPVKPVNPTYPSKKHYYYYMRIVNHRRNPVA